MVTYNIPLLLSFLVQLDFFLGNLNDSGLTIQVYSRGPGVYITGAVGDITLNALGLRLDAEYYLSAASNAKLAEQKSKPHQWKFLNTAHQTQSLAMTAGNIYPILGWRQDNGNRSNQKSKFDFLATRKCLVKIDEGQQKIKIVCTN